MQVKATFENWKLKNLLQWDKINFLIFAIVLKCNKDIETYFEYFFWQKKYYLARDNFGMPRKRLLLCLIFYILNYCVARLRAREIIAKSKIFDILLSIPCDT